jgi:hypothetical protein
LATWHMYTGHAVAHNQIKAETYMRSQGVRIPLTPIVAILGGNSVVGRALEVLLQGLGYDTRLIEESGKDNPQELLGGIQLLLAAPTVNTESRERFLSGMRSTPATATIPVLTLSTAHKEELADQPGVVPWPCRLEDLKGEIDTTLCTAANAENPAKPA